MRGWPAWLVPTCHFRFKGCRASQPYFLLYVNVAEISHHPVDISEQVLGVFSVMARLCSHIQRGIRDAKLLPMFRLRRLSKPQHNRPIAWMELTLQERHPYTFMMTIPSSVLQIRRGVEELPSGCMAWGQEYAQKRIFPCGSHSGTVRGVTSDLRCPASSDWPPTIRTTHTFL